ncbi:HmuY family protein, partial [Bacteroides ovatus]
YYSLEKGKEVSVSEESHAENTDWDIAFNRYNVRTNSGASGKGKGGALLTNIKDLAACTTVPQGTFTVDAAYTITAPGTGFPPPTMESTANEVLCKAITFAGPPPTYTPSDYVFIVRTASGKYAKLKAKSFYDDEGKSGIYSFEYAIQPDGSTNLN